MNPISRRLEKLEKIAAPGGRIIAIAMPYGQEDNDHSHLLPPDITNADIVVVTIDYSSAAP